MTSLIDTHAHLCDPQFSEDRDQVLSRAAAQGVQTLVEIADSPQGWEAARAFSERNPGQGGPRVVWACGFHPHYAGEQEGFNFDIMVETARLKGCVAVGEIGLDYVKSACSKEDQTALFRNALEVAAELNKPVSIHCREAQADTLRILKSFFGGLGREDGRTGEIGRAHV